MPHMGDDVAPDGSPVEVYRALTAEPALSLVRSVVHGPASILDLGCGPGRLAIPLAADGHRVVAVDDSAAMLAQIAGTETVLADIWTLELGRRFDVVLALSHLVNEPQRERRVQLLRVCRAHVSADGVVIVQRYAPGWQPVEGTNDVGEVSVHLHDVVEHDDGSFSAVVTYRLRDRQWAQPFTARVVDDVELASLASAAGFVVGERLDADGAWIVLRPDGSCS
jgi:SAM-dependent methyltransferase